MELSQRAYAARHGVTRQAIREAVRRGVIPLTASGKIDVEAADAAWGARHRAWRERKADAAKLEARRRRAKLEFTRANMRMLRRKAAKMRSGLVDRKRAQAQLGAIISTLFTKLHDIDAQDPVMAEAKARILANLGGPDDLAVEASHVFALLDVEAGPEWQPD